MVLECSGAFRTPDYILEEWAREHDAPFFTSPAFAASLDAVSQALAAASAGLDAVAHAAFRLAGVDWPEDEELCTTALATRVPRLRSLTVRNDGYALLRCGQPSGESSQLSCRP